MKPKFKKIYFGQVSIVHIYIYRYIRIIVLSHQHTQKQQTIDKKIADRFFTLGQYINLKKAA